MFNFFPFNKEKKEKIEESNKEVNAMIEKMAKGDPDENGPTGGPQSNIENSEKTADEVQQDSTHLGKAHFPIGDGKEVDVMGRNDNRRYVGDAFDREVEGGSRGNQRAAEAEWRDNPRGQKLE